MKVLQVISSVSPAHGGPTSAIVNIERALAARDVEVTTVTTNDDGPGRTLPSPCGRPITTADATRWYFAKNMDFYLPSLGLALWLKRHVAEFDLVHVHAMFSFAPVAAAFFARRAGVPYIIRPLGVFAQYGMTQRRPTQKRLSLFFIERKLIESAAAVHFTSQAEMSEAQALGLAFKGAIVPLGVDVGDPASPRAAHDPFRLLYLSRIDRKKNLEGLFTAFATVLSRGQRAMLNVAGSGEARYVESLKMLADNLGISAHVNWLGYVDGERKTRAFAEADAFILTSHSENFGIAVVEALAAGVPCLVSRGVATAPDIEAARAGIVVDPNPASIAEGIEKMLADPAGLQKMSAAAYALAARDFSLDAMGERLDVLYRGLAGAPAAGPSSQPGPVGERQRLADTTTPMILTFNEESNIGRTLEKLSWAKKILVVDSGSTDGTLEIVGRYPQAVVLKRSFDTFAGQCNYGLQHIDSEWVLSLDADYVLSDELVSELASLRPGDATRGYRASFVYKIGARPLRDSLYPGRTVLYRRAGACYGDDGHTQRVKISGRVLGLKSPIYHDDRKPLARWFSDQARYAAIEAGHLLGADRSQLSRTDRVRLLIVPAPFLIFAYALIVKRGLLDGWPGWYYALQRLCAEVMLSIELLDRRFRSLTGRH